MKLLVTAFEPFGGEEINPALEAVKLLPPSLGGAELLKLTVPTSFSLRMLSPLRSFRKSPAPC